MHAPAETIAAALSAWGLDPTTPCVRTMRGESNQTYLVGSPLPSHVLRVHGERDLARVDFEHELLAHLSRAGLPFATPIPLELRRGGTAILVATEAGPRPAALFRWIPGEHPDDGHVRDIARAGEALAQLDVALAGVTTALPAPKFDGDLTRVNGMATDLEAVEELDAESRAYIRHAWGSARELYPELPRQLIHGDFALGNVLLVGDRVSGMLDFEFAGTDARAMELAGALTLVLSKTTRDVIWRPFVRAYLSVLPLTSVERAAVPELLAVRNAVALLWWLARERSGAPTAERIGSHIDRTRAVAGWLREHRAELDEALAEKGS